MKSPVMRLAFAVSLTGLVLWTAPRPAAADDESFHLSVNPIEMGPLWTDESTNSSKFDEYRDMSSGATMPLLHIFGDSADSSRYLDFLVTDAVREDGRYTLRYGVAGRYGITFDYNKIPHRFGSDGTLLHTQTAPGLYEISDATQRSLQGAVDAQRVVDRTQVNFTFLDRLLQPHIDTASTLDLKLDRSRTRARLDLAKMGDLALGLELNYESRKGNRPYGAAFGFGNAIELPEPIDYDTARTDIQGEWNGKQAGLRFGYGYSSFTNHVDTLRYDNPFRVTDATDASAYTAPGSGSGGGAAMGLNVLSPDNQAHLLYASGRSKLGDRGWVDGSLNYTSMKQDDPLVAYSTNTAIKPSSGAPFDVTDRSNLPETNAGTKVGALNLTARTGVRFGDGGSASFHVRHYDYNNKSKTIEFPGYVRFDAVWEEIGRITVPTEYSNTTFGAEVAWAFDGRTSVGVSFDRDNMDRKFREIAESHDNVVKLRFDTSARDWVQLHTSYERGQRSIGDYLTEAQELSFTHPEGINNQPGLRKFDEAARKFNAGRAIVTLSPSDQFDVAFNFGARKDDYDESDFGLVHDKNWQVGLDATWSPRHDVTLYGFGTRSDRESFQRARQSGGTLSISPLDDWELTLSEITSAVGAGLNTKLARHWTADVSFQWNKANGDSEFFSPPGGVPDLALGFDEYDDNEYFSVGARVDYAIGDNVSAGIGYRHEDYQTDRFSRDGLKPYLPATLLLDANDGNYNAEIVVGSLRLRF